MNPTVRLLALSALLSLPFAAAAQDQGAAEPAPGAAAGTAPEPAAGVAANPEVGQLYVAAEFADWQQRCRKTAEGNDPCQLYQLLRDATGNSVAEINLFPLPEGGDAAAGANVITPLGTLLTANVRLSVDGGAVRRYPFSFCERIGCFSRIGLTAAEIDEFQRGKAATVTIVPASAPDETVALTVSLAGFTAGWKALLATPAAAE